MTEQMTNQLAFAPEDLRPFVRAATRRVGVRRTDRADVARILMEHGACSTAAALAIDAAGGTAVPPAESDQERIAALSAEIADLARAGWSVAELHRVPGLAARGGNWSRLAAVDAELDRLYAPANRRAEIVDAAVADWWAANLAAVRAICDQEAAALLAGRAAAAPNRAAGR